jgi:hypothetical protein
MNEVERILREQIGTLVIENAKLQAAAIALQKELADLKEKAAGES